jgi:putative pyruvate formate lyase activating enzyme
VILTKRIAPSFYVEERVNMTRTGSAGNIEALYGLMSPCTLCPRKCLVDRSADEGGFCGVGETALVASAAPHFGEEPPLVGRSGSGTIFLAGCNLGCTFCQNYDISHLRNGAETSVADLAEMMVALQKLGCHNVNFVTPTHVSPMMAAAVARARDAGLSVPIVYNCGGYESVEALRLLEGIVDIYMPDVKYGSNEGGGRLSAAPDYWDVVREAVREMHRQVGDLDLDGTGVARGGLLVRHLVMPQGIACTEKVCEFLANEISLDTYINIMAQYRPMHRAHQTPGLERAVTGSEVETARNAARQAGLYRGF